MMNRLRLFACLLALCALLTAPAGAQQKARGFDTREVCAQAAVDALRSGDIDGFLACYAIEETARHFNLAAYASQTGVLPLSSTLLPPTNALAIARNKAKLTGDLLLALANASTLLSNPEAKAPIMNQAPLTKKDYTPEQMAALAETGDALTRLAYQGLADPTALAPKHAEAFEKQRWQLDVYGMAEWQEAVLTLALDGRAVRMPVGFVRYDGGWLLRPGLSVAGQMMGVPAMLLMAPEDL